jgi:hypothetical protein
MPRRDGRVVEHEIVLERPSDVDRRWRKVEDLTVSLGPSDPHDDGGRHTPSIA